MKRPLAAVVLFYAAGLLLAALWQPRLGTLFAAAFVVLVLFFAVRKGRPLFLCALLVLAGWTNLVCRTAIVSPGDLRRLVGDETENAIVRGRVTQTPQLKLSERRGEEKEHTLAEVRVTALQTHDKWRNAEGEITVFTPGAPPTNVFAGQAVEISGTIARPAAAVAEGLFDDRAYLKTRGIFYELKTQSASNWRLAGPGLGGPPLTDRFLGWSRQTLGAGLPEDPILRLLWAMSLGWRTAFTGDIGDPFLRAGTMHLFAIDGLRIALISGILVSLLRVLRLPRAWCGAIAIPAIWFYTAATGWEASAVRASVMMSIVLGGWALKRPGDLLNSLAAAAFVILLWDPRQLYQASFQLSFFVMLTIGLLLPRLNDLLDRLLAHDPLLPPELVPTPRRVFVRMLRAFGRFFNLSLAAWIGSMPLSALYFHLFSLISPVANLVAVPLGTLALMSNLGALICGTWFPFATELFNNGAWFFMAAMSGASDWFTKIPGAYIYVAAPSWISIGIFYGVLFVALSGWLKTTASRMAGAAALVLILAMYGVRWEQARNEIELTILPLEGSHAIWVRGAGRNNDWLIDCGSDYAVNYTVKPFLRGQGINSLPHLVLSQGNAADCGGVLTLDQLFGIRELWTSAARFRSPVYNRIVSSMDRTPSRHRLFECGTTNGCWTVLWPPTTTGRARADDNSLVLLGTFSGTKILLLPGLGRTGQGELAQNTPDLHADILIGGGPDKDEWLDRALVQAVHPRLIVIADSEFPAYRQNPRTFEIHPDNLGMPVIHTSAAGAVKIVINHSGWTAQAMDGEKFQGD